MANRLETDRQTAATTPPLCCTGVLPHFSSAALLLCCSSALRLYCSAALLLFCTAGCGTTRSSDTNRTATEQLLISDAIDRAVQSINLQPLAVVRRLHGPMRWLSLVAGIVGLVFVVLMVVGDAGNPAAFGPIGHGGAERMIVYPAMLWMLAFGGWLLGAGAKRD